MNKLLIPFVLLLVIGCSEDKPISNISKSNEDQSHNMGQNCMTCHKDNGSGKGIFIVAGTVYTSDFSATNPNATIYLTSQENGNGEVLATIEVDKKGNFFTTEQIILTNAFPYITNSNNESIYMSTAASTGQCNSCHGVSTSKIYTP